MNQTLEKMEVNSDSNQRENKDNPERKKCGICSKKVTAYYLESHIRSHLGEKYFKCQTCSKSYVRKGELVKHQRRHTGDKPFQCSVCSKSFSQSSNLIRHKQIHTGETPYLCHICGKSFSQKSNLNKHMPVHNTNLKPFSCVFCEKRFAQNKHLFCHLLSHNNERPFVCICNEEFSTASNMRAHVKRIHKK